LIGPSGSNRTTFTGVAAAIAGIIGFDELLTILCKPLYKKEKRND
jgi:hypothetical protein